MTKKEFFKKLRTVTVDGREVYRPPGSGSNGYRTTLTIIVRKVGQSFKEGKYIYGSVIISGSEWLEAKKDLSVFKERIEETKEDMYKIFLKEFPNQTEQLVLC